MSGIKHIFLHIGHYKTGTSAIQDFLSSNADELRRRGFAYPACSRPRNNPTNHGRLSLSLAKEHGFVPPAWYGENTTADEAFAELNSYLDGVTEENVILSSEEFVQLALRGDGDAAVADLKARLGGHKVTIIFYVREPFSLLKSWFNEVNKSPSPTRTFPVFFMNLSEEFLSQKAIWSAFAQHFGQDNLRLVTYKSVGSAHLAEFLAVCGCDMPVPPAVDLKQLAQPDELLELVRLAKRKDGTIDDYTITRIHNVARILEKAQTITADFNDIIQHSDVPRKSALSAAAVIDHYAHLLRSLDRQFYNQKEADNLRDLALAAEKLDLDLARALMQTAQIIRPNGPLINSKVADYLERLGA